MKRIVIIPWKKRHFCLEDPCRICIEPVTIKPLPIPISCFSPCLAATFSCHCPNMMPSCWTRNRHRPWVPPEGIVLDDYVLGSDRWYSPISQHVLCHFSVHGIGMPRQDNLYRSWIRPPERSTHGNATTITTKFVRVQPMSNL